MSAPNSYWTWDSNRKDYYHAEKLQNGTTRYTWASSLNSSGTAQQQGHNSPTSNVPRTPFVTHTSSIPQPREPYGVSASGIAIPYRPATSASLAAPHGAVAYSIQTSSPPVVASAGPQINQQPWPVQPRDQYGTTSNRTSSVRVPGSDPLPVGLRNTYNGRSSSSYTYGQGSGTGIASPGQAASQPLAPRTTGDSTSPFVSPVQMNAGLDDASGQSPVAGIARTSQAARQPFSSRTASHSISVSSSPLQNRAQLHDTNTQGQYRSAIPVLDKTKPDPSREALYPKRTSSVTVHTTKGRGSEYSTVYQDPPAGRGLLSPTYQSGVTAHSGFLSPASSASSAPGKKRAQTIDRHDQSPSEDDSDTERENSHFSAAREASRISYGQGRRNSGPSNSNTAALLPGQHLTIQTSAPTPLPTSFLDPSEFKYIKYKTKKFFVVGKVFMIFHIENAGATSDANQLAGPSFTTVAFGEHAHHQFRRFVVVKEMSNEFYCYCCPITTYGSRGASKPGVDQTHHAIAYTGSVPPARLPGETKMNKDPIRIVPVSEAEKLDPRSRINIGKIWPISHNIKVKDIGQVHRTSLPKLLGYRKAIRDGG